MLGSRQAQCWEGTRFIRCRYLNLPGSASLRQLEACFLYLRSTTWWAVGLWAGAAWRSQTAG